MCSTLNKLKGDAFDLPLPQRDRGLEHQPVCGPEPGSGFGIQDAGLRRRGLRRGLVFGVWG